MTDRIPLMRLPGAEPDVNATSGQVLDAALKVHTILGPGLLESVYHVCLAFELERRGHDVRSKPSVPVRYEGIRLDAGFQPDLIVDGTVLVELKSVAEPHPIHDAQVLTYLKLTGCHVGWLINFNVEHLKEGGYRRLIL